MPTSISKKQLIEKLEELYILNDVKNRTMLDIFINKVKYTNYIIIYKIKFSDKIQYLFYSNKFYIIYRMSLWTGHTNNCSFFTTKKKIFLKFED